MAGKGQPKSWGVSASIKIRFLESQNTHIVLVPAANPGRGLVGAEGRKEDRENRKEEILLLSALSECL